jgi:alkylhydroperoxidase family enzyme
MTQRLNFYGVAPKAFEPLMAIEAILKGGTLEHALLELVKIRASQINGCTPPMRAKPARPRPESIC